MGLSQADRLRRARTLRSMTSGAVKGVRAIPSIIMRAGLDDLDALEHAELFPEWAAGKAYRVDDVIRCEGELWRVNQDHTAQAEHRPCEDTTSLYTHITVSPSGWEVWQQPTGAHDAYALGYIVLDEVDGNVYRSLVDSNVWGPPHEQPQFWELYQSGDEDGEETS